MTMLFLSAPLVISERLFQALHRATARARQAMVPNGVPRLTDSRTAASAATHVNEK